MLRPTPIQGPVNNKRLALWCCAAVGAAGTAFWVVGIGLEGAINVDERPFRLLAIVGVGAFLVAASLAWSLPNVFLVPPSVSWSTVARRMLVGAVVSYPLLGVCYAVVAAIFITARGSLHERDAPVAISLIALWLPLWTLPLSAAVFTWRRSRHINPAAPR
jgi:hypothetical protein